MNDSDLLSGDYDKTVQDLYTSDEGVNAIIHIKLDVRETEIIAGKIAEEEYIKDVLMVTGDADLILKAEFPRMKDLREFVLHHLSNLYGIKETKTFIIINTVKESGIKN